MSVSEEINQIYDGWKNLIFKNPVTEELAKKRIAICLGCTHLKKNTMRCGICHCPLIAAIRAREKKCLKGKW